MKIQVDLHITGTIDIPDKEVKNVLPTVSQIRIDDRITESQAYYLTKRGVSFDPGISKYKASDLIAQEKRKEEEEKRKRELSEQAKLLREDDFLYKNGNGEPLPWEGAKSEEVVKPKRRGRPRKNG